MTPLGASRVSWQTPICERSSRHIPSTKCFSQAWLSAPYAVIPGQPLGCRPCRFGPLPYCSQQVRPGWP
jgi:hypothetical protein